MTTSQILQPVNERWHRSPEVSVVVPVYNEQEVIEQTLTRLMNVLSGCCSSYEIVFVDDGSSDSSLAILQNLCDQNSSIALVSLSRNFGKELALTAGLEHCSGDAVIVIDADLQDPPECIPDMLTQWRKGFDIVTMRRRHRDGESLFKRFSAWCYYRVLAKISDIPIPSETGDFRLLSRRTVDALAQLGETQRYMKGLFAWIGFPQTELLYDRDARAAGTTKWNYFKLWRLALDGITSFSTAPLRVASILGFVTAFAALGYAIWSLMKTWLIGDAVQGFPTLIVMMSFLGGVQLLTIGILGEYVGRLFMENKRRPKYLVQIHRQSVHESARRELESRASK